MSPARRRACVEHIMRTMTVSERRACRALGQHRSTQRKVPRGRDDEEALTADLVALAEKYGRYGYRKISALLKAAGWFVNDKRVERMWRREGLKVPAKQPKRGRIWDNAGSCVRLRPEHRNHVWSYDFVEARTHDGRKIRMLNVLDEFTHDRLTEIGQERDQAVVLGTGVEDAQPASSAGAGHLDEDFVAGLGHVDGYENAGRRRKLWSGHGRSVSGMRLRTPSL